MITLILNDFKDINPKNYDLIINNINLYNIQCTCGQKGTLIRHGYYSRTLINNKNDEYFP